MATDSQAGSSGGFLGLSLFLSFRRNQVASMDTIDTTPPNNISNSHDGDLLVLDRFQSHVARHLRSLLPSDSDSDSLLSLPFLSKLLDVLVSCDREFYHLLLSSSSSLLSNSKPAAEFLDRSVRALDLCNAASAALLSLRHWRRQADVAASAAALRRRRALRRALSKLFPAAAADCPGGGGGGRSASARFLSKNWSGGCAAAAAAPGGMAAAACTMSCLLGFAAWALAAAVPFLDRGERPAPPRRQVQWAAAMAALQERIAEECSQRRRGGFGVLAEVRAVETHARCLTELLNKEDTAAAAAEDELSAKGAELAEACRALEEGTEPLERQVRAVFHRVAATRAEVIRCLDRSSRCSAPAPPAASAAASSSSSSSSSAQSPF